jgi:hypothetical protein
MAGRKQQTHAKRARELAVKERRERKAARKAERAAGGPEVTDGIDSDGIDSDAEGAEGDDETAEVEPSAGEGDGESAAA